MSQPARDSGFTLIEVMVTIALACVVMGAAVAGWNSWAHARAQSETASELRTVLRSAQQRAITEGRTMCVTFDATEYTVWRGGCTSGDKVQGPIQVEGTAELVTPVFAAVEPSQSPQTAVFTARGTASTGQVVVTRPGSSTEYQVKIQGFTGRAYLCRDGVCDES